MNIPSPSQAYIDLDAYAHNLGVVRAGIPENAGIIAVVKADAYGHGITPIAQCAEECGVEMLGVACLEEGVALRSMGILAPILVMMQPDADTLPLYMDHDLVPLFSTRKLAESYAELAQQRDLIAPFHCHVDTGMGRQGFALEESLDAIVALGKNLHLHLQGLSTHFPVANHAHDAYTLKQIDDFSALALALSQKGIEPEMIHTANSAAVVNYPESHFNAVRVGLMSYGVWPTNDVPKPGPLLPVLQWESHITLVRHFPAGAHLGYECTYETHMPMRGAIVPIGYADGYPTALSNKAQVLIDGILCPVCGRVSMDQILVDITPLPQVKEGDKVILLGRSGDKEITALGLATLAGCIPYEILTGIGNRVPRLYSRKSDNVVPAHA